MLRWALHHIAWFLIRCAVTFACLWTIQNVIHREGYYVEFDTLLVCAACLIVGMRFWMPISFDKKEAKETTWGG